MIYYGDIVVDDGFNGFWRLHPSHRGFPRHQCNKRIAVGHWVATGLKCPGCGITFTDFNRLQFKLTGE